MSVETFNRFVQGVEARPDYRRPAAFAVGLATYGITDPTNPGSIAESAKVLDTWFPVVNREENYGSAAVLANVTGYASGSKSYRLTLRQLEEALEHFAPFQGDGKRHANIDAIRGLAACLRGPATGTNSKGLSIPRAAVVTFIGDLAEKPVDVHDAYLRLHLLSARKVRPHGLSMDGLIPLLNIVVWTNDGPFDPETWPDVRLRLRAQGIEPKVHSVDKFPRMTDYVVPSGVRIADADRVRLGAHLAEGTTVMHEGFCNFNAGTLGPCMVEGRISAGVVVGAGTDIGGGASIMGTLSGGGTEVIRIGEHCLIGANGGTGISLGDNCTIEAGCYVTASSKVKLLPDGPVVKATELSGKPELRYWRNSQTGAIEALPKRNQVVLNPELHKH
jgi:2,3,4,5-tetrahydropyridine-2,6-dicarboxylate N-succinyltransferase